MLFLNSYIKIRNDYFIIKFISFIKNFGVIISTLLRKVLMSLIYGFAVVMFAISRIYHEFCYSSYFIEDVISISLNFSIIKLHLFGLRTLVMKIFIKNVRYFYARDLNIPGLCIVSNPNKKIISFIKNCNILVTLLINKGIGFNSSNYCDIDWFNFNNGIIVNSYFSPLKKITFNIINYYNYDIIKFLIKTNCLVSLKSILNHIFNFFNKNLIIKNCYLGTLIKDPCVCFLDYLLSYNIINIFPSKLFSYLYNNNFTILGELIIIKNSRIYTKIFLKESLFLYLKNLFLELSLI